MDCLSTIIHKPPTGVRRLTQFVGGKVSPIGAVLGELTMAMAASPLLTFMRIPPDWQVAANGAILIIVLAARVLISRGAAR